VLEVGCGTGCVALSIASERPGAHVTTTDVSHAAVELAVRNRDALGLADAVDVVECDLASGVDESLMGGFDLLVSNPPYIPTDVLASQVPAEVRDHEPGLALDGGPDGLDVYRRLLELAPRALRPGGAMCVELYEGALDAARDLALEQGGWADIRIVEDLTHRPRVLVAVRGAQVA
jgi:HemK-like putative methylase